MKVRHLKSTNLDLERAAKKLPRGPFLVHENGAVCSEAGELLFRVVYGDPVAVATAVLAMVADRPAESGDA